MRERTRSACLGLLAGLTLGLFLWLLDYLFASGTDHMSALVVALTLGCGIMAFLFPVSGISGFWIAGVKGILGEGGTLPDPTEPRSNSRDG